MYSKLILKILLISCTLNLCAYAEEVFITSTIDPKQVAVGDVALYRIEVRGTQTQPMIHVPSVEGLKFSFYGPQQSITSINGQVSAKFSLIYKVQATKVGSYIIPSFDVKIDGKNYQVPPAQLTVDNSSTHSSLSKLGASGGYSQQNEQDHGKMLFLIDIVEHNLYLGETVPCRVRLLIPAQFLNQVVSFSLPIKNSDEFTILPFNEKPREQPIQGNGQTYLELSWVTALTPIKVGEFSLSFKLNVNLLVPVVDDDSFLQGGLLGALRKTFGTEKTITLETEPETLTVVDFLSKDKPPSFTGGIGEFTLKQQIEPQVSQVGEPLTMTLAVEGMGNFDRIQPPQLNLLPDFWKAYPVKTNFIPKDVLGTIGTKQFEYILVPLTTAITHVPEIHFSFFNTIKNAFEEIVIPAKRIEVKGAPSVQSSTKVESKNFKQPTIEDLAIKLNIEKPSKYTKWLKPNNLPFWGVQGGIALVVMSLGYLGWVRKCRQEDPTYHQRIRLQKKLEIVWKELEKAKAAKDNFSFYKKAVEYHTLLINQLVDESKAKQTWTIQEYEPLWLKEGLRDKELRLLRDMSMQADKLSYAKNFQSNGSFLENMNQIFELLKTLKKNSNRVK